MIRRLVAGMDDRVGGASALRRAVRKAFPDHWSFLLGEVALYCFVLLVLTGVFLTFFFDASTREVVYNGEYEPLRGREMSAAYASVLRLSFEVRAGLVMRQIHHWAAVVFVAAIAAHAMRVFFTGAFRRPRDVNWVVGVTLLILAMLAGFTGYSLPDDLLSGTGLRIGYSVLLSIPVIGVWAAFLVFGGEFPTAEMIGRLHVLHIMLIPAAIGLVLGIHLALVWRQRHTQHRGGGRTENNVVGVRLWPNFAFKSMGLMFVVFGVLSLLGGVFQINPVWIYGPFEPEIVTTPSQPDWYMGWLEGALRIAPPWKITVLGHTVPETFFPGVVMPGIVFTGMFLWPWIEQRLTGDREPHHLLDRPRDAPVRTAVGAAVLTYTMVLTLAGSNDIFAAYFSAPVERLMWIFRVLVLVLPPVVGVLTYWAMNELRNREELPLMRGSALVRRTPEGGFGEVERDDEGTR